MKRVGWLRLLTVFLLVILFNSCQKEVSHANAVITGFDQRMCICCGGLMVNLDGGTQPYTGNFKLIDNSNELGIDYNDSFPIYVDIQWELVPGKCNGNYIKVKRLVRK